MKLILALSIYLLLLPFLLLSEEEKGDIYFNAGFSSEDNIQKADSLFNLAIEEYSKSDNKYGLCKSYFYKGMCLYHYGELINSVNYFVKSNILAEKFNFGDYFVKSNSQMSFIISNQSDYKNSEIINKKNFEYIKNSKIKDINLINTVIFDNALLNYKLNRYKKSLDLLNTIDLKTKDSYMSKITYNLKGLVFQEMNMLDSALSNFYKSLEHSKDDNIVLINLIRYFYRTNQNDSLKKYYNTYKSNHSHKYSNIINLNNSLIESEMFYYIKEYDKSLNILNNIEHKLKINNLVDKHITCIELIIKNNIALGDFKDLNLLNDKKDSLNKLLLQNNINISTEIISRINKLESENQILEIKNENARVNITLLVGLVLFLLISIFSLIKFYYSKKDNFKVLFDMYIHLNMLNMIFKNRFTNLLSRNQKNLLINYDHEENKELFLTHDEFVKLNISMQETIDKTTNELLSNKYSKDMMKEYSINMN